MITISSQQPVCFAGQSLAKRYNELAAAADKPDKVDLLSQDRNDLRQNKAALFFEQLAVALDRNLVNPSATKLLEQIPGGIVRMSGLLGLGLVQSIEQDRAIIEMDGKQYLFTRYKDENGVSYKLEHRYGLRTMGSLGRKFLCITTIELDEEGMVSYSDRPQHTYLRLDHGKKELLEPATQATLDLENNLNPLTLRTRKVPVRMKWDEKRISVSAPATASIKEFFEGLAAELFSPERYTLEEQESAENARNALDQYRPEDHKKD